MNVVYCICSTIYYGKNSKDARNYIFSEFQCLNLKCSPLLNENFFGTNAARLSETSL